MEFRDPDYIRPKTVCKDRGDNDKAEKIKSVIRREFGVEIEARERALAVIDERLSAARKTLHRLRYAIVNRFYNSKKFELNSDDIQNEAKAAKDPATKAKVCSILTEEQKRIHPAIKNILNEKCPSSIDELPASRPLRKKPKLDNANLPQNVTLSADLSVDTLRPANEFSHIDIEAPEIKNNILPMYVEPKGLEDRVLKINPVSRNKQKKKFRIIIGNTSKYVGPSTSNDLVTHRWLLYIRGPHSKPDISHIIDSITIQLHDSYAPQNVVKLRSSPFHLSKRGWGEFPIKLRIHFKNGIFNKPINLVHNLKLDRYHTGLQTLGAETVADVWLYTDENMIDKNDATNEQDVTNTFLNTIDSNLESEHSNIPKIRNLSTELPDKHNSNHYENDFEIIEIKQEPVEYDDMDIDYNDISSTDFNFANDELSNHFLQSENIDDQFLKNMKKENLSSFKLVQADHPYSKNGCVLFNGTDSIMKNEFNLETKIFHNLYETIDLDLLSKSYDKLQIENVIDGPVIDIKKIIETNRTLIEKITDLDKFDNFNVLCILKNVAKINNSVIKEYCRELFSLFHHKVDKTLSIIKDYIKTLEMTISTNELILVISLDKAFTDKCKISKSCMDDSVLLLGKKVLGIFDKLFHDSFSIENLRCMVTLLLRRMEIIDPLAANHQYIQLFPYATVSDESFFSLKLIKRRNLLWTRAKMINYFLKNYSDINSFAQSIWTTKQIVAFTIHHGFFPVKNTSQMISKNFLTPKESFECDSQINTKTSYNILMSLKEEKCIIKNEFNTKIKLNYDTHKENIYYISDSSDDEIEICNAADDLYKKNKCKPLNIIKAPMLEPLPYTSNDEKLLCQYIEKNCANIGIEIKNQNIGNNYSCGLIQKLILNSLKNLIEDILRRALSAKTETLINESKKISSSTEETYMSNGESNKVDNLMQTYNQTSTVKTIWNIFEEDYAYEISLRDIFDGLKTREEFDFLTNLGMGLENIEYEGL